MSLPLLLSEEKGLIGLILTWAMLAFSELAVVAIESILNAVIHPRIGIGYHHVVATRLTFTVYQLSQGKGLAVVTTDNDMLYLVNRPTQYLRASH